MLPLNDSILLKNNLDETLIKHQVIYNNLTNAKTTQRFKLFFLEILLFDVGAMVIHSPLKPLQIDRILEKIANIIYRESLQFTRKI